MTSRMQKGRPYRVSADPLEKKGEKEGGSGRNNFLMHEGCKEERFAGMSFLSVPSSPSWPSYNPMIYSSIYSFSPKN
jgi:hypothetical protein